MAWTELSRITTDSRTLTGGFFKAGYAVASGSWQAKYFAETVVEYEEVSAEKYNYRASVYLHFTEVISPDILYLYDRHSQESLSHHYTKVQGMTNGEGYNGDEVAYYRPGANYYTLVPGQTAPDILFYQINYEADDMLKFYKFDGSLDFSLETQLCVGIGTYWKTEYNNNIVTSEEIVYGEDNIVSGIPIEVGAQVLTATDFTDEENPSLTYKVLAARKGKEYGFFDYYYACSNYEYFIETIDSMQIALSFDGTTPVIPYRDLTVSTTAKSYSFSLTEAERETLRANAQGSDTVPIYFLTKVTRTLHRNVDGTDDSEYPPITQEFYIKLQRNFTVVDCNPTLNPTVKDVKTETLALTGDENTFIRYESIAEYTINAVASKGATIVSQSVTCGSKTIKGLPHGVITNTESGTFIFNVTDSRSMGASSSVFKNLVEYVKPTCYQKAEIEIIGETGANIVLKVSGNYFNGSFGAASNTLKLEVRHTDSEGNWGEWAEFAVNPTFNGVTYELETTFTGFDYGKAYTFQSRITDRLNLVESAQYVVKMLPVFDWSETDFNFNVPVNINAEDLSMNNKTIIRHSEATNNTVLSASNGDIYVRPRGTDTTTGETIFYNNGNVKFNGTVTFADGTTGGGNPLEALADYVIEIGETEMDSNGMWYWRKWNSGKAEAWGCRNFDRMAISTTWGNLYRSEVLTQDLPYGVFIRTPDSININIVHASYGGWICKYEETAPSADTTGSFIFVRPASATATPTNIGFYIVGEWK